MSLRFFVGFVERVQSRKAGVTRVMVTRIWVFFYVEASRVRTVGSECLGEMRAETRV